MKNPFLLLLILLFSCDIKSSQQVNTQETPFGWLISNWQRSMSGDSVMNHTENWSITDSGLSGVGITDFDNTLTKEVMTIHKFNDQWVYTAHPEQNEFPTSFVITEIKDSFFRCENDTHDFPKYIEYLRRNDSLFAYIGDQKQRVTFTFTKYE